MKHAEAWISQTPTCQKCIFLFSVLFFLHLLASSRPFPIPFLHQPLICLAELCSVLSLQINFPEGYVSLQVQSNLIDPISSCHCGSDVEKEGGKKTNQHRVRIAGINPNIETNKQHVSSQETVAFSVFFLLAVFKVWYSELETPLETPCLSKTPLPLSRQRI